MRRIARRKRGGVPRPDRRRGGTARIQMAADGGIDGSPHARFRHEFLPAGAGSGAAAATLPPR